MTEPILSASAEEPRPLPDVENPVSKPAQMLGRFRRISGVGAKPEAVDLRRELLLSVVSRPSRE